MFLNWQVPSQSARTQDVRTFAFADFIPLIAFSISMAQIGEVDILSFQTSQVLIERKILYFGIVGLEPSITLV